MTTRYIQSNEECISSGEIVKRFFEETGCDLHATNAGQAAKKLDLDYIEIEIEVPDHVPYKPTEKRYSLIDVPLINAELRKLAVNRGLLQDTQQAA